MTRRSWVFSALSLVITMVGWLPSLSVAQTFPQKPIRLVVPFAPAGTPMAVVNRLREAAHKAMDDPSYKAQAEKIGGVSMANSPDEFAQQIKTALARYQRVARVANIQPE